MHSAHSAGHLATMNRNSRARSSSFGLWPSSFLLCWDHTDDSLPPQDEQADNEDAARRATILLFFPYIYLFRWWNSEPLTRRRVGYHRHAGWSIAVSHTGARRTVRLPYCEGENALLQRLPLGLCFGGPRSSVQVRHTCVLRLHRSGTLETLFHFLFALTVSQPPVPVEGGGFGGANRTIALAWGAPLLTEPPWRSAEAQPKEWSIFKLDEPNPEREHQFALTRCTTGAVVEVPLSGQWTCTFVFRSYTCLMGSTRPLFAQPRLPAPTHSAEQLQEPCGAGATYDHAAYFHSLSPRCRSPPAVKAVPSPPRIESARCVTRGERSLLSHRHPSPSCLSFLQPAPAPAPAPSPYSKAMDDLEAQKFRRVARTQRDEAAQHKLALLKRRKDVMRAYSIPTRRACKAPREGEVKDMSRNGSVANRRCSAPAPAAASPEADVGSAQWGPGGEYGGRRPQSKEQDRFIPPVDDQPGPGPEPQPKSKSKSRVSRGTSPIAEACARKKTAVDPHRPPHWTASLLTAPRPSASAPPAGLAGLINNTARHVREPQPRASAQALYHWRTEVSARRAPVPAPPAPRYQTTLTPEELVEMSLARIRLAQQHCARPLAVPPSPSPRRRHTASKSFSLSLPLSAAKRSSSSWSAGGRGGLSASPSLSPPVGRDKNFLIKCTKRHRKQLFCVAVPLSATAHAPHGFLLVFSLVPLLFRHRQHVLHCGGCLQQLLLPTLVPRSAALCRIRLVVSCPLLLLCRRFIFFLLCNMSATCNPSPSRPYASSAESDTSLGSQDGAMRPRSIPPPPGASPASTCSSNTQGKAPMAQAIYAAPSSSVSGSPSPSRPVPDCGKRIAFSSNSTTSDSPVFGFGCAGALPGPLALAVPAPAPALCHDVAALLRQLAERDAALQQAEEEARSLAAQLCEVKLIVAEQRAVLDRLSLHPPPETDSNASTPQMALKTPTLPAMLSNPAPRGAV
eukprot:gene5139-3690_t